MSVLRALFGPSKEDVWQELCRQIGAHYVAGNFWNGPKVQVQHGDWLLTLDTFVVSSGKSTITYTRMRAPFVNRDGFRFRIYRAGLFTELGKVLFGTQDLAFPDDPLFDRQFVIQGSNRERVYHLISNEQIRTRIAAQPQVYFTLKEAGNPFGSQPYPPGVDELYFQVVGVMTTLEHLRWLFELFAETMNHLGHLDSGHGDDLNLLLGDLTGPGGVVQQEQAVVWDGNIIRRRAAHGLGRLADERAVPALLAALQDPDGGLRGAAAEALGRIGQPGAALHLIPLLGDRELAEGTTEPVYRAAEEALTRLGRAEWVRAFQEAIAGRPDPLAGYDDLERGRFAQALRSLLVSPEPALLVNVARALAAMGVTEAVPEVQKAARRIRRSHPEAFEALDGIAEALRRHQALPRPAATPAPSADTLPLPATGGDRLDPATLPRPGGAGDGG